MRILIVEDEPEIQRVLRILLEREKYSVDCVSNGMEAIEYMKSGAYDAVVLDVMLPGKDGISVLKTVRGQGITTPVLMLTAKADVEDRVAGLDAGADDYLPKPFASTEFLARIRALLRRKDTYIPDVLTLGNLSLHCATHELCTAKKRTKLNNKEFQIMELFLHNPGNLLSADLLMEKIWGWESDTDINVVWTYISYLRKKLKQLRANVEIQSIRGSGYVLTKM